MKKSVLIALLIIVVLLVSGNAFYTVQENEYACTFRFSEIVDTKGEAGLYFKIPFID